MAILEITTPNTPDSIFTVMLEGRAYDLRLQWNTRDASWYLGVTTQQNLNKITVKLTNGLNSLRPYSAYAEVPSGYLTVVDKVKRHGRLERDSFSSGRFSLIYLTEDELDSFEQLSNESFDYSSIIRVDQNSKFKKQETL